jgi:coenzyme F420-reducing hydrogenase alpha subunit
LLHAPDFFGCRDAVELAEREPAAVRQGLELKKAGNLIMETVGGRAIHPVNVRVGGFYRSPSRDQIAALVQPLLRARELALSTVEWVAGFSFPGIERDYLFVALHDPSHYAIEAGRVRSSSGLDLSPFEFEKLVVEEHLAHSTALHARLEGRDAYLTGPLARFALNYAQLGPSARGAADAVSLESPVNNPFRSIVVRAVELVEACDEALRLVANYEPPEPASVPMDAAKGVGVGATEAPRGLLLQRYEIDATRVISAARIVPPTSQNQATIEADLRRVVEDGLALDDDALTKRCEQAVRNHDPCISCAAHFLDVKVAHR